MTKVYHKSGGRTDWETPGWLFEQLDREFRFDFDACAEPWNTKCDTYITPDMDALTFPWRALGRTAWMNPPYGTVALRKFLRRAWEMKAHGVTTVCLIPARTDTEAWGIFYDHNTFTMRDSRDEVRFLKGRVQFVGAEHGAGFPSAVIVLRGVTC